MLSEVSFCKATVLLNGMRPLCYFKRFVSNAVFDLMVHMKTQDILRPLLLVVFITVLSEGIGFAQGPAQRWGFGVDLGMLVDTIDSTVFALGANADYYITSDFSIGPMIQIAPGTDYTQVSSWAVAKLHFSTKYVDFAPFTGPGFTWAHAAAGRLSPIDDDDASMSLVAGVELGLGMIGKYAISASGMYYVQNISFGTNENEGNAAFMFGIRF